MSAGISAWFRVSPPWKRVVAAAGSKATRRTRMVEALLLFPRLWLENESASLVRFLSPPQCARLPLGRAFMQRPRLILLDEPDSLLTRPECVRYLDAARQLSLEVRVATIVALREDRLAVECGRRVLAIKTGQLIFDGPTQDFVASGLALPAPDTKVLAKTCQMDAKLPVPRSRRRGASGLALAFLAAGTFGLLAVT